MATKLTPKDFVEALKDWSILDVVEAVKAIEDEFGIKAAAAVATVAAAPAAGAGAEPVEELSAGLRDLADRLGQRVIAVPTDDEAAVLDRLSA